MEAIAEPVPADPSQYVEQLVERLDILRRNDSLCDVTISVNSRNFRVHKCVLAAASPFFFSLLKSDMRESQEQLIKIELEEATESVMQDVLQYIYTGNLTVFEETAHNMIATADYLLLPSLKTAVGRFLMENVTIENCIFNYYFADKYRCEELKEKAREVINSNFTAIMETESFLDLNMKQVIEWVSSDDITANAEEDVFKGIVNWVNQNRSEREEFFPNLLHQVRLISISHDFLLNQLVKNELVTKNTEFCLNFVLHTMSLTLKATDEQVIRETRKCLKTHRDAIFVCGGGNSLTMCYFPEQNLWYKLSNMFFKHDNNHTPSQCRGKVFVPCKASDKLGGSQLMECYTPATNSWGAFQVATTFSFTAVLKSCLYTSHEDDWLKKMYRYNPEKNYWDQPKAPPTCRLQTCIVTDDQYLYIIGGISRMGGSYSNDTERFDPDINQWEKLAPINESRRFAFGTSMNAKVYIAGGHFQYHKAIPTCEVYNPLTNEWQLMASLRVPRASGSMVSFEGRLYVVGGYECVWHRSQARILAVEVFCSEENEWKEKTSIPVQSFETPEEVDEKISFKACFARLHREMIDRLQPLRRNQRGKKKKEPDC